MSAFFTADQIVAHLVGDYLLQSAYVGPVVAAKHLPDCPLRDTVASRQFALRDISRCPDLPNHLGRQFGARMILAAQKWRRAIARRPVLGAARDFCWALKRPMPTALHHVARVLGSRARLKVAWVAAARVVALVAHHQTRRQRTVSQLVGDAVRPPGEPLSFASPVKKPVAITGHSPCPRPAAISRLLRHLRPKSKDVGAVVFVHRG